VQYIYLIKSKYSYTEVYKIGIANNPQVRLAQLQTGNPYELEIVSCYGFNDAGIVEKSLHQAYKEKRLIGEWFELNYEQVEQFDVICSLLRGIPAEFEESFPIDEIEYEDEAQSPVIADEIKFDYASMFADGWYIEPTHDGRGNYRYWQWRKSIGGKRQSIYGGRIKDLPFPVEEMRKNYETK